MHLFDSVTLVYYWQCSMFNYILNSIKTGRCFCSSFPLTMNRISNSAIFFFAKIAYILLRNLTWAFFEPSFCPSINVELCSHIFVNKIPHFCKKLKTSEIFQEAGILWVRPCHYRKILTIKSTGNF